LGGLRRMNSSPLDLRTWPRGREDFRIDLEGNPLPKLEELGVITFPGSATSGSSDLGFFMSWPGIRPDRQRMCKFTGTKGNTVLN